MSSIITATLSYRDSDGITLHIEETTVGNILLEACGDVLFSVISRAPDVLYDIRWGKKDPEYKIANKSVGHVMYTVAQWCGIGFGVYKKRRNITRIPVTAEWVREHFPHGASWWDETEDITKGAHTRD